MGLMAKAGLAVAVGGLTLGSVFGAGTADAAGYYAAIAVSQDAYYYGTSVDRGSFEEARDAALDACGSGCEVLAAWANGCGALVASNEGVAAASGPNRAEAERAAYQVLTEITPAAALANVGSSQFSGARVIEVVCTANAS
ncbi:DUF4189 domain-containing protein [Nocardia farcinica]|uniref:DUF4189 domain-containing protein n=1 Tax=Nocardia farcinica TaxID=37329 RepID=UPI0024586075|nr:DUF4189 domain-containing protein [Nocardia farcinica]